MKIQIINFTITAIILEKWRTDDEQNCSKGGSNHNTEESRNDNDMKNNSCDMSS